METLQLIIVLAGIAVLGGFWALVHLFKGKERAMLQTLETAQRKLDVQTARLSILARALPNLRALLTDNHSTEGWKMMVLDEARALIRAESALYWRVNERDQRFEFDGGRGPMVATISGQVENLETSVLAEPVRRRATMHLTTGSLVAPVIVEGSVWGVYQFVRAADDPFQQRDVDTVAMFFQQTSLALENQSMISNREKFYLELVQALADTLDARDSSTEGQTRQARALARGIGKEMALPEDFIYYLEFAALMHDIGNIAIDEQLLKKPGKLTAQEFDTIKKHPELGYKILAPVSLLAPVAPMVLYHQEWFNGKGYPEGLSGEEIPLGARIVAVLDAWGGMTSHRPWRKALSNSQAIEEMKKSSGTQFDPTVVDAFISTLQKQGIVA